MLRSTPPSREATWPHGSTRSTPPSREATSAVGRTRQSVVAIHAPLAGGDLAAHLRVLVAIHAPLDVAIQTKSGSS